MTFIGIWQESRKCGGNWSVIVGVRGDADLGGGDSDGNLKRGGDESVGDGDRWILEGWEDSNGKYIGGRGGDARLRRWRGGDESVGDEDRRRPGGGGWILEGREDRSDKYNGGGGGDARLRRWRGGDASVRREDDKTIISGNGERVALVGF